MPSSLRLRGGVPSLWETKEPNKTCPLRRAQAFSSGHCKSPQPTKKPRRNTHDAENSQGFWNSTDKKASISWYSRSGFELHWHLRNRTAPAPTAITPWGPSHSLGANPAKFSPRASTRSNSASNKKPLNHRRLPSRGNGRERRIARRGAGRQCWAAGPYGAW